MDPKSFHRKLAAILSADVAGYSRLMQGVEAATVTTLESHKQAFFELIKQHRGRVVDSPGDNLLAEFASVVDAVQCAVAVQKELQARNSELPENRHMLFRIGVNLGDVIEEGDRIYGDGVNIAARLESIADPGGVCVSKTAFDHIESKLPLGYEFLGEQTVKNIAKPVGAYRVVLEPRVTRGKGARHTVQGARKRIAAYGLAFVIAAAVGGGFWHFLLRPPAPPVEKADPKQMALPLPELPSIAVLPFVNLSEDPKQQLLCDGITDNIINALSKIPRLFVIARNSTFTYKGKVVKAKQVSEELGVRYVLEGSLQRSGDRIRISTQMVDALTGHQLLSERFDGETEKLFDLQDDIALKVLSAVQVKLAGTSPTGMKHFKGTHGLDCMLKLQEGFGYLNRNNLTDTRKAHQVADEVIAMCPEIPNAHRLLAAVYTNYYWFDSTRPPGEHIQKATELLQKTLAMDDTYALAHGNLSILYLQQKEYDKAIAEGERALSLDQGSPFAAFMYAKALLYSGRPEEAIPLLEKAIRLNPLSPSPFLNDLGLAFRLTGRLEEAAALFQKSLQRAPNDFWMHAALAGVYIEMGREEEARAEAAEVMRINPKFSLEWYGKRSLLQDRSVVSKYIDALRKTGLPDKPPVSLPDKPSIAVLPFTNMSDDPKQEYFSDGMAEQLITGLSQSPDTYVTARTSSFAYKGKSMTARQIAEQLGVRYLLEGSVQRDADRVRINVQLIDGISGNHIWADHFDRKFEDLFALQDAITMEVMAFLNVKFSVGAAGSLKFSRPNNLKAYEHYIRGLYHHQRRNPQDLSAARQLYEEAIKLDPGFGAAYRMLGFVHADEVWFRIAKSPENSLEEAEKAANKCIALTPGQPPPYPLLSMISLLKKDWDNAILYGEKAVQLSPNEAGCYLSLGMALRNVGRFEESIVNLETALRLSPLRPLNIVNNLAWSCVGNKQYDKAILLWNETLERNPDYLFAYQGLAAAYELSGRHEKALWAAENVMRVNPKFSVAVEEKMSAVQDEVYRKRVFDALCRAGLK